MAEGKGKKKGGKLPIIMVAVLVVAGGGFFAMNKGGDDKKKSEPEIELGAVESLGDEFLVNVGTDGREFLVCKISVQLRKPDPENKDDHVSVADPAADGGGHGKGGDHTYSIARNAILDVLSGLSLDDMNRPDNLKILRREIAAKLNHEFGHHEEEESSSKKKKKKDEEEDHGHEEIDHEWLDEIGLDHEEGPVLKVLITDFAYQKY